MDTLQLTQALVEVKKANVSALARSIGYERANLGAALAGRRNLPDSVRPALLKELGVEHGHLALDQVHFWVVGSDLRPLLVIARALFVEELEIAGIWREGGGVWDPTRLLDRSLYAIYGRWARIVILRSGLVTALGGATPIGPESVPNLRWRGGSVGASTMVKLPAGAFDRWQKGDVTLDEFDRVLRKKTRYSWDEVRLLAEDRDIAPDAVAAWILSQEKKRSH